MRASAPNAVHKAAGRPAWQIRMKTDHPFNGATVIDQLVAKDHHASEYAHHEYVRADDRADPEMDLEEDAAEPGFLRVVPP
jgi:hypothetical protein